MTSSIAQSYCLSNVEIQAKKYWQQCKYTTLSSLFLDNTPNVTSDHLENHQLQSKVSQMAKIPGEKFTFCVKEK